MTFHDIAVRNVSRSDFFVIWGGILINRVVAIFVVICVYVRFEPCFKLVNQVRLVMCLEKRMRRGRWQFVSVFGSCFEP